MQCPACAGRDIEFIESSGHAVCVQCGTVLEENAIVSSVEFQGVVAVDISILRVLHYSINVT